MDLIMLLGIVVVIIMFLSIKNESIPDNQGNYIAPNEVIDFEITKPKPESFGKNKWLHPSEDFGKMEEGVAEYADYSKKKGDNSRKTKKKETKFDF